MSKTNQVPGMLVDYRAFYGKGSDVLIGTVDVTLPTVAYKKATIEGAGMGGGMEVPVAGQFEPMTVSIKYRTLTAQAVRMTGIGSHEIDVRGSIQNSDSGKFTTTPIRVSMVVSPSSTELGTLNPGSGMDPSGEYTVTYIAIYIDGKCVREIDQANGIDRVDGKDEPTSAAVRKDLGL